MKRSTICVALTAVALICGLAQAELKHQYTFEDGTTNDYVGTAHGTLVGGAVVAGGALVTTAQDQWMAMPGNVIAMNTYPEVSIEEWYTPSGTNTSWSMLAYFGAQNPGAAWMGTDYFFITSARDDNKSRAAISVGDSSAPWGDECGADGPEYDDAGVLHQMVGTLTATDIALYIDGVLISSAMLVDNDYIGGISQQLAYLAKGGYGNDPEWIGSIQEFNIYNHALSDAEVAANFAAGPVPEPTTIALLSLGSLALIRRRKS